MALTLLNIEQTLKGKDLRDYLNPMEDFLKAFQQELEKDKAIVQESFLEKPKPTYHYDQYLQILYDHGLSITEESRYLGALLQMFITQPDSYKRQTIAKVLSVMIKNGCDLYNDIFFITMNSLLRNGSIKSLSEPDDNFEIIIDLFHFLFENGYDINYTFHRPLLFESPFGLADGSSVQYDNCSLFALAVIYNRFNVVHWLLQFTSFIPIDPTEDDITTRRLDVDSCVVLHEENQEEESKDWLTVRATSNCVIEKEEDEEEPIILPTYTLAKKHGCFETSKLLDNYTAFIEKRRFIPDPCIHDISEIVYNLN